MNIQAMMAQAKKIQSQLEKTTKEIEGTTFKFENDNILVECLGTNEITKIVIKNEDILSDAEMLGDIVQVAVNEALKQVKEEKEKKIGKYANGLGGLF